MSDTVLVSGGAGRTGSRIASRLKDAGRTASILTRRPPGGVHYQGMRNAIAAAAPGTVIAQISQISITRPDAYPSVRNTIRPDQDVARAR